jgi:hypothetical protein
MHKESSELPMKWWFGGFFMLFRVLPDSNNILYTFYKELIQFNPLKSVRAYETELSPLSLTEEFN